MSKVWATKMWGCTTEKQGQHNRKLGFAQLFYKMVASKLNLLKSKEKVNEQ